MGKKHNKKHNHTKQASKVKVWTPDTFVRVPTTGKGGKVIRRVAKVVSQDGALVKVVFRTGKLAGMFAFADANTLKKGKAAPRKTYRFGKVLGEDYEMEW